MGTMFAGQGDIRREGAPPATSEDLGGHSEQFAASEFFNVEVVEEFFCVEVVEEVFVFAAIRLLLRGCRPSTFFKASRLKISVFVHMFE